MNKYHAFIFFEKNKIFIDQKNDQKQIKNLMYIIMIICFNIAYTINKLN